VELLIKHLINNGDATYVIYAILAVAVVAILRGVTIQAGDKSISIGKKKETQ